MRFTTAHRGHHQADIAPATSVRLLEIEPDLGRFLTPEERKAASGLAVPVRQLSKPGLDINEQLERSHAFGGVVLDGMVLHTLRSGTQTGARLLGPGDIVSLSGDGQSMLLSESTCRTAAPTRLALLGSEVLAAARQWPRIVAGLHTRLAEQTERLGAQLVICQLSRVDQRLLALMWLLAESWGHVTLSGTTVPLTLTHDTLGSLVGARRPTITLALRDLTERGAIVRQDRGWLLLESPPEAEGEANGIRVPTLIPQGDSRWASAEETGVEPIVDARDIPATIAAMRETLAALHEHHVQTEDRTRERLKTLRAARERCARSRERVTRQRLSRMRSRIPSS
jgi:CRP/FNR family transcriptional regulator, cyclic AMP receptor protein